MNKLSLIIEREYLSRVRKKSFIVMSLIGPLLFAATMFLPAWLSTMDNTESIDIAIVDHTGKYANKIPDKGNMHFAMEDANGDTTLQTNMQQNGYDAYVVIEDDLLTNPSSIKIYSEAQVTIAVKNHVSYHLNKLLQQEKVDTYNISNLKDIINDIQESHVEISTIKLGDDGAAQESSVELTMVAAILFSMLVYIFILFYGTQVMRGVMEEKNNRIIEVIISSVKPFELMMGKIVGIAMVALTQFAIWALLTFVIATGIQASTGIVQVPSQITNAQALQTELEPTSQTQTTNFTAKYNQMMNQAKSLNLMVTLAAFIFFFLGGYLLYASLFAALGAALDSETDSQQFVMPVMMPLILSIYIAMTAFRNPNGDLAFWFSMIPFTSPIVMMARIPFQIATWEIVLSMVILAATFVLTTWFAGRVYRVGILMHGKKSSYKELWKWFLYANR